ncbi:hypothetical protein AB0N05_12450 [Nocardia sp. NPDC051030]|uniref:hypothetical protein n=1 Tax=Nocardia sp. NPDC051030 TaxID=3155162 RepID=UPI003449BCAF
MSFLGGVFGSKRKQFGQKAFEMMRANPAVASAEYDGDAFEISYLSHDGTRGRMNLTTVFRRCENASPAEAQEMLHNFVSHGPGLGGPEVPQGWEAVAPHVRPLIRQAGELATRMEGQLVSGHVLWRPVLPCLMETLVIDQPTSMPRVHPSQLAEWGVDAATVFATARANLTGLALDTVANYDPAANGGMLHIPDTSGDLYAGSLPLVDGWLAGIGAKAGARPIVFIAQNTGVLVGVEYSDRHVLHLVNTARELFDNAVREVSPVPYTLDEAGRLIPYRVPPNHLAAHEIGSAECTLTARVYGHQYDHLRADLDAGIIEDYAAKVMHVRAQDGTELTFTTWTDTVPSLLPRTDNVVLVDPATSDSLSVTWETLESAVPLPAAEGIYPPRYHAHFHPAPDIMAHLRAAGVA